MKKRDYYSVLLVEDEMFLRQSLVRSINELDDAFKVTAQASNGEEALQCMEKEDIQIVITDIQMPIMNGLQLAERIKRQYPDTITIILTGYAEFNFAQEAIRQDVFEYLLKPVDSEDLHRILTKAGNKLGQVDLTNDVDSFGNYDSKEQVDYMVNYIQEHYMEAIDMGMMAEQMGFTSAYLSKIFKRYTGTTPVKMLTNIRMHNAKKLLNNTSLSIQEIGKNVGYPDQFHFSKTFRNVVGMNPSAFRERGSEE
jgi:two-component system response regulator YesN